MGLGHRERSFRPHGKVLWRSLTNSHEFLPTIWMTSAEDLGFSEKKFLLPFFNFPVKPVFRHSTDQRFCRCRRQRRRQRRSSSFPDRFLRWRASTQKKRFLQKIASRRKNDATAESEGAEIKFSCYNWRRQRSLTRVFIDKLSNEEFDWLRPIGISDL